MAARDSLPSAGEHGEDAIEQFEMQIGIFKLRLKR